MFVSTWVLLTSISKDLICTTVTVGEVLFWDFCLFVASHDYLMKLVYTQRFLKLWQGRRTFLKRQLLNSQHKWSKK